MTPFTDRKQWTCLLSFHQRDEKSVFNSLDVGTLPSTNVKSNIVYAYKCMTTKVVSPSSNHSVFLFTVSGCCMVCQKQSVRTGFGFRGCTSLYTCLLVPVFICGAWDNLCPQILTWPLQASNKIKKKIQWTFAAHYQQHKNTNKTSQHIYRITKAGQSC